MVSVEGRGSSERLPPEPAPVSDRDEFRWQLSRRELPVEQQRDWLEQFDQLPQSTAHSSRERTRQRRRAVRELSQRFVQGAVPLRRFEAVTVDAVPRTLSDARLRLESQLLEHAGGGRVDQLLAEYLAAFRANGGSSESAEEQGRVHGGMATFEARINQLTTVDEYLVLRREIDEFLTDVAHRYRVVLGWKQAQRRVEQTE